MDNVNQFIYLFYIPFCLATSCISYCKIPRARIQPIFCDLICGTLGQLNDEETNLQLIFHAANQLNVSGLYVALLGLG